MPQQPLDHPKPPAQAPVPPLTAQLDLPPQRWVKPTFQQVPLNHALAGVIDPDLTDGIGGYAS